MIPYRLWVLLAYTRIPGNALSFGIRKALRWSRGQPVLENEPKENLFAYLIDSPVEAPADARLLPTVEGMATARAVAAAEAREAELRAGYHLEPLHARSTAARYRKNLYLIDILEQAAAGLDLPPRSGATLKALDVGSQDWHYAFGLERWLRYGNGGPRAAEKREPEARQAELCGVEVDGYGIYPDLRSRKDYALAYADQTGNPKVTYEVLDFRRWKGAPVDILTWFYPFVTRHHLLLWGLPVGLYDPAGLLVRAAAAIKPGGWMLVFAHTLKEHLAFRALAEAQGGFDLEKEGNPRNLLVDFHADVEDRRYSVWRRRG